MKLPLSLLAPVFTGCAADPKTAEKLADRPADQPSRDFAALDTEARRLMARENVESLALALIEDGQVAHVAAFGRRSVERDLPLTPEAGTGFPPSRE